MIGFNCIPKVAVVPILIMWFGIGEVPAILTAFLISFFPIVVNVATGLATMEPELEDVLRAHADLESGQESDARYRVAGRLLARRGHGKAAFLDLVDRTGRMQLHARKDVLGDSYEGLVDLDLGDVVGAIGTEPYVKSGP